MKQIKDFTIQRFRGLRDLKIENLGQINLFVGNNNSGKTSALEAFSIFADPLSWRNWYDTASMRESAGVSVIDRLIWVFPWGTNNTNETSSEINEILLSASGNFSIESVSVAYEKFTEMEPLTTPLRLEIAVEEREKEVEGLKIYVVVSTKQFTSSLHQNITFSNSGSVLSKNYFF